MAAILSVAMMLRYSLCLPRLADAVSKAVEQALESGVQTTDVGGSANTGEMGDAIVAQLEEVFRN